MGKSTLQKLPEATETQDRPSSRFITPVINFVKANREALQIWLSWRLAFLILPIFAAVFMPRLPSATGVTFNNPIEPWIERLVWCWSQWDSNWYITIAEQGYIDERTVAFYPLYPFLLRCLGFLVTLGQPTAGAYRVAGVLISSLSALVMSILFVKLLTLDYSPKIARLVLIYFLAFPTAFFLLAVYTEGLFMALSVGAFYFARRERWLIALILVSLAVITRQQGVLVGLALLIEYGNQVKWNWRKINYRVILLFGLPALTLGSWLIWNWLAFNNPFASMVATQKYWGRYLTWPWLSFMQEVAGLLYREPGNTTWQPISQFSDAMPVLNLTVTVIFIVLAIYSFKVTRQGRLRPSYFVFLVGCLILPLASPVTDDALHSLPRYLLLAFPAFIILAQLGSRWRVFNYTWLISSLTLSGLLVARFTLGYWVA